MRAIWTPLRADLSVIGSIMLLMACAACLPVECAHASGRVPSDVGRQSTAPADSGMWLDLPSSPVRYGHAAVLDARRRRLIVFAGYDGRRSRYANDLWALSLSGPPRWSVIVPVHGETPSPRAYASAVYDSVRDRVIVFGGSTNEHNADTSLSDVWELSLDDATGPAWRRLSPTGPSPDARWAHSAVFDPAGDRMIVYGGRSSGGGANSYFVQRTAYDDIWSLSFSSDQPDGRWVQQVLIGAPTTGNQQHTAVFDPVRRRMIVFGGSAAPTAPLALALDQPPPLVGPWVALTGETPAPPTRLGHAAVFDAAHDRMLVFGGHPEPWSPSRIFVNETWAQSYPDNAWTLFTPDAPAPIPRHGLVAAYDAAADRMVISGGSTDGYYLHGTFLGDSWALSLTETPRWEALSTTPPPVLSAPPDRFFDRRVVYDSRRDRLVVSGGIVYDGDFYVPGGGVAALSLTGQPEWSVLVPGEGLFTTDLFDRSCIYDPVRDQLVEFGGSFRSFVSSDVATFSFETGAWSEVVAPNGPMPRNDHSAIYDPVRDRMIVFGGYNPEYGDFSDEIWSLSLAGTPAWKRVWPTGTPGGRAGHAAIYDPVHDRMLIFGGQTPAYTYTTEVWALQMDPPNQWTRILPDSTQPSGRVILDSTRNRLILYGDPSGLVWEWSLEGPDGWSPLSPAGRSDGVGIARGAVYDPAGDRMVTFGNSLQSDVRVLRWRANSAPVVTPIPDMSIPPESSLVLVPLASDPDGDEIEWLGANLPEGATVDPVGGAFAWTPRTSQAGAYSRIALLASDRSGGQDTVTFAITVETGTGTGSRRITVSTLGENPFREAVALRVESSSAAADITASVWDVHGRRIAVLAPLSSSQEGITLLSWDGRGDDGRTAPAGLYVVRVVDATGAADTRLVRLR